MGLLPFGSDDSDDGCTAHHYGEYEPDWDALGVRVSKRSNTIGERGSEDAILLNQAEIRVPKIAYCMHDGCNDRDESLGKELNVAPLDARFQNEYGELVRSNLQVPRREDQLQQYADDLRALADAIERHVDS